MILYEAASLWQGVAQRGVLASRFPFLGLRHGGPDLADPCSDCFFFGSPVRRLYVCLQEGSDFKIIYTKYALGYNGIRLKRNSIFCGIARHDHPLLLCGLLG